ncbi:MAG TPA: polyprenyl synthetase family protein [Conexibacter sp.]|jgi:geranylgeranyl pyrophosphate synthase|nr:polyprenyl synthetase family protein [Conexibacter sp.]
MTSAAAVDAVVRAGGPQLAALLDRTEARLAELAAGHGPTLALHATATISAGGKRLRPLLVFLAAGEVADATTEARLVRAAVAVELIHSASLVHDDVLDGAALRRGAATIVAAAGRTVATATGDLLFSRAFAELAAGEELDDVRALSAAASALAAGELLQRADAWDSSIPLERYVHRCALKTGSLFEAACRLGALATAGPPARADALALFGRRIGLAFQLLDDVLDVSGPASRTGKARGTDLLDGTVTLPLILARERDPQLARVDLRALSDMAAAEEICDRIADTGALTVAKERALAVVGEARDGLPPLPSHQQRALELVAEGVVERYG